MKHVPAQESLLTELISGDESRAEAAACELAKTGESAHKALQPLLQSSDADQRWWVVRTLAQMSAPRLDWLIEALRDPSVEVREAAVLALASHPSVQAAPALIRIVNEEDGMIGSLGVQALVGIGPLAVTALLEAFPNAPQRARIHIMRALAQIRDHRAIPLMMKTMDEDSAALSYWAREGLERLGLNMVYIKLE